MKGLQPSKAAPSVHTNITSHSPSSEFSSSPSRSSISASHSSRTLSRSPSNVGDSATARLRRAASRSSLSPGLPITPQRPASGAAAKRPELSAPGSLEETAETTSVKGKGQGSGAEPSTSCLSPPNPTDSEPEQGGSDSLSIPDRDMKRSRPATSNRADESANKVARRKTWFGFGSSQTDPDPEVRASDSSRSPFGGAGHDTTVLSPEEAAFRAALFAGGEVPAAQGSKVSRKQSLDPAETAHPQVQTHESVSPPSKDVQLPSQGAPVDKTSGNAKSPEGSGAMDYATATLRANTRRSINAAKRASWIRWKDPEPTSESPAKPTEEAGGEATSEDPSSSAPRSDHLADKKPGGSELLAVPSSSLPTESPRESTDSASSNRSRAPLARTIKRRTWLGQMVEEPQMESPPSSPLPFGAASQSNSKSEAALSTIAEPTAGKDRPDEGADSDPVRPAKRDTSVKSAPLRRIFSRAQIDASTGASASSNTGEGSGTASAAPEPAAKTSEPPQSPSPSHALPAPAEKNPQDSSITPAASASGTWRFSLWGRGEPAQSEAADSTPVAPEPPSSSGVEVAKDQALPATDNHATLSPNPGSTDGELNAPTATSSVADAGSNYTYSSYLARWLPSWSYDSAQAPIGEADSQGQGGDKVPSPAEQVKAEALARQETTESKDAPKPDTDAKADSERSIGSASASSNPRNAILNNATRSSWISYFASRNAARVRAIEASPAEGPEVMDLDEDPSAAPAPSSGTATPQSSKGAKTVSGLANVPKSGAAASGKEAQPKSSLSTSANEPAAPPVADLEPPSSKPTAPLTTSKKVAAAAAKVQSKGKKAPGPVKPVPPNLVLPTFVDTFARPPRSLPPRPGVLERTLSAVNTYLFSKPPDANRMRQPTVSRSGKGKMSEAEEAAQRLPRTWEVMGEKERAVRRGAGGVRKAVVIGVHGWFSQSILKTVMGEPTGTSIKFASMMADSVRRHMREANMELNPEAVTVIPLEGDGKVSDRVDRLFAELLSRPQWVKDLLEADVLFVAAHSQGSIVSTHLIARLIEQKHVRLDKTRICLLAMCGIHHGPFAHLKSSVASSYIQYFETSAAAELFDFQSSNAAVSQHYAAALRIIATAGVKIVYVGSVDDQVVPLYSALHWSASHPSILRALYIDGTTFARTDFLTNLLVFCTAVRNSGLTDHGLLTLLSASVAGSLYGGMGHSRVYEEKATYDLACRYLFETTHPCSEPTTIAGQEPPVLKVEPFTAQQRQNPYSLPWALRGIFEDAEVKALFEQDMRKLLDDYEDWNPVTKTLKDVQWRLEPMRGFPRTDREGKTQPQRKGQSGTQSPNLAGQDHPAASGAKL